MQKNQNIKVMIGISWFLFSLLISVLNDAITKDLSGNMHIAQLSFFRFLFSFLTMIPFMLMNPRKNFYTSRHSLHFFRGLILFIALVLWGYGLSIVPISTATVINFTIPLYVLILAYFILREQVTPLKWAATIIGLLGVIIVLNPSDINFNPMSSILIIASLMFATLDILNKKYVIHETMQGMLFYSAFWTTIFCLIPAVSYWKSPVITDLLLLFLLGAGANIILFALLKAFSYVEASSLASFRYTELLMSASVGWIFFGEAITKHTIIGACIIIPSTFLAIYINNNNKDKFDDSKSIISAKD